MYVCMYVCGYIYLYVDCGWLGMVFGISSRTKARSATSEVSKLRYPERALLRHNIISRVVLDSDFSG